MIIRPRAKNISNATAATEIYTIRVWRLLVFARQEACKHSFPIGSLERRRKERNAEINSYKFPVPKTD